MNQLSTLGYKIERHHVPADTTVKRFCFGTLAFGHFMRTTPKSQGGLLEPPYPLTMLMVSCQYTCTRSTGHAIHKNGTGSLPESCIAFLHRSKVLFSLCCDRVCVCALVQAMAERRQEIKSHKELLDTQLKALSGEKSRFRCVNKSCLKTRV